MNFYFVKTPWFVKFIFRNWVWRLSKNEKTIYLTFDDGPTPEITKWVLDVLDKFNAKATFFCIGKNVVQHTDIFRSILKEGHAFGNHTYNHLNGWNTPTHTYIKNSIDAAETTQNSTELFRPPYGKLTLSQSKKLRKLGYKIIMWDVLSADFDSKISKEQCLQNVLKNTENGSILVFHDSVKAAKKLRFVLPKVLEYYDNKGYRFQKII